ncbi:MAG TPA: dynamin family protein [Trueperaceae bacterium]
MNLEMSEAARGLLGRERSAIADLRALLSRLDAAESDLAELKVALTNLEGLFLLVVVGEYNSGKSSLLNALLGEQVMLEGVTPTTDRITIVTYGETSRDLEEDALLLRREYPAELLRDLAFVDTPGTNAIIRKHQELTERFIPRADLVLFVTSADRPFTETERGFLELIRSWGKKVVLVVNKMDILEDDGERKKVLDYVREHARETLGVSVQVFGVCARRALRARLAGEPAAGTGIPELEAYIEMNLAVSERLRLKLQNPLGVAKRIAESYQEVVAQRLTLLADDRRTLDEVDRQLRQFEKDMRREFTGYLDRIKTVLLEVERRGEVFFDDTVRLSRLLMLMNNERVREAFEARVIRGADLEIERAVAEMVDWFIQRNLQLWEDVMTFVQERRQAQQERVIGEVGGRFQYDREALIRTLGDRAEAVLGTYDEEDEARRLAESLQGAVMQTGLWQVGGIGLGAALIAFLNTLALDVTGIMAGLTLAGLGLLVLPRRRTRAKRELHEKMQALRDGLAEGLGTQFDSELRQGVERLQAAITPYTRFVRSELERLETLQGELGAAVEELRRLRGEVETLGA